MNNQDYNIAITVNATAQEAFNAINNIAGWWTAVCVGNSTNVDDVFTVTFGETWITIKITESVPGKKMGWLVTDCNKHWLKDKKEWNGTTMVWDIAAAGNATQITFTHIGLQPAMECYNGCEKAWNFYLEQSLFKLLNEGKGMPEQK